jgi:hypothetical protein
MSIHAAGTIESSVAIRDKFLAINIASVDSFAEWTLPSAPWAVTHQYQMIGVIDFNADVTHVIVVCRI